MAQGHIRRRVAVLLFLAFAVVSCVPPPDAQTDPEKGETLPAVQSLVDSARAARVAGRLDEAASDLERALRLSPDSGSLWHELALVRRDQQQWDQAISSAQRSNSYAGADLRGENWLLIAECRRALGDEAGALEAEQRAKEG